MIFKNKLIYCTLSLFISATPGLQAQYTLQGKVTDTNNKALPYAVIVLCDPTDSSILQSALPDQDGNFRLTTDSLYHQFIKVSALGFQEQVKVLETETPVQTIDFIMKATATQLAEISILQTQPLFERKVDRTTFHVRNSITAMGDNALGALQKSPGVLINRLNNSINLAGKSTVSIWINDRLVRLSGEDLFHYLQSIPSENIDRIEIITTPPAKYDAAGNSGLIQIILKKDKKSGFNGNITTGYEQASRGKWLGSGNLNYTKGKFLLYANGNYAHAVNEITERLHTAYDTSSVFLRDFHIRTMRPVTYTLGMAYDLHRGGTIGLEWMNNFFYRQDEEDLANTVSTGNKIDSVLQTLGYNEQKNRNNILNLSYVWKIDSSGKKLILNANQLQYEGQHHKDFETQHLRGDFGAPTGISSKNKLSGHQDINIISARADLELPYSWAALSLGAKLNYIKNKSGNQFELFEKGQFIIDPEISNVFNYAEQVQALYISAQKEINKWSFQAGLRGEWTQTESYSPKLNQKHTNKYAQLFPTGYIQYQLNEQHTFNLNYSKRINRPDYKSLDPYRAYSSPYFYTEGNPYLQPYFSHNLEWGYTYKSKYIFNAFYQYAQHSFSAPLWVTDPATYVVHVQTGNYFKTKSYGMSFVTSISPLSFWEAQLQAYFALQEIGTDYNNLHYQSYLTPTYYLYTNNSFSLNKSKTWLAEFNIYYAGPSQFGFFEWKPIWSMNGGMKALLWDKKATIALNAQDIFASIQGRAVNKFTNQSMHNYVDTRNIRLTFSYNFGQKDSKTKKESNTNMEEIQTRIR